MGEDAETLDDVAQLLTCKNSPVVETQIWPGEYYGVILAEQLAKFLSASETFWVAMEETELGTEGSVQEVFDSWVSAGEALVAACNEIDDE